MHYVIMNMSKKAAGFNLNESVLSTKFSIKRAYFLKYCGDISFLAKFIPCSGI